LGNEERKVFEKRGAISTRYGGVVENLNRVFVFEVVHYGGKLLKLEELPFLTSQKTQSLYTAKINQFWLYREIFAVCCTHHNSNASAGICRFKTHYIYFLR